MAGRPVTLYTGKQGLRDRSIRAFYEDRQGNIWCGGYINGATMINPVTNAVTAYSTSSGLPDNSVRAFWQDSSGTMWVGTRYGGVAIMRGHDTQTLALHNGLLSKRRHLHIGGQVGKHLDRYNYGITIHCFFRAKTYFE